MTHEPAVTDPGATFLADPDIYGGLSLTELEVQIKRWARELDLEARFFQTNSEAEFVEYLHRLTIKPVAAKARGDDRVVVRPNCSKVVANGVIALLLV